MFFSNPDERRNILLVRYNGEVIGFVSLHFQPGKEKVLHLALRTNYKYHGKGYFKQFDVLTQKILRDINPKVQNYFNIF